MKTNYVSKKKIDNKLKMKMTDELLRLSSE
jgi:hypothetical protein